MIIGELPHHAAWRDAVQSYCERIAGPAIEELDLDRPPSRAEWDQTLGALLGKGIIDSYPLAEDGSADYIAMGILLEELARRHHVLAFHTFQRLHVPRLFGEMLDSDQAERFHELFFTERSTVAACFSEPGAGSDVRAAQTVARPRPDGTWVINGLKTWVSGASHADAVVVYTRIDTEVEPSGFGLFIVEASDGYDTTQIRTLGLRAHDLCEVTFDDVVVPGVARIRGNVDAAVLGTIGRARTYQGSIAVGFAQAALDMAIDYARTHHQFGRPIGEFQLIQKLIAEIATGITTSRLMTLQALNTLTFEGEAASRTEASMAKLYATETAWRAASKAMEVFGSLGLTVDCGLERLFRDARMLLCPDGTSQIHEMVIGRAYTGLSALIR